MINKRNCKTGGDNSGRHTGSVSIASYILYHSQHTHDDDDDEDDDDDDDKKQFYHH